MAPSMEIGDDVSVTVQVLTDAEIFEDIQGDTVEVEEDDEEGTAEGKVAVKTYNEEVRQAIDTLLTYLLFIENREIGAVATKISSVVESELAHFSKQMTITDFFKKQ